MPVNKSPNFSLRLDGDLAEPVAALAEELGAPVTRNKLINEGLRLLLIQHGKIEGPKAAPGTAAKLGRELVKETVAKPKRGRPRAIAKTDTLPPKAVNVSKLNIPTFKYANASADKREARWTKGRP